MGEIKFRAWDIKNKLMLDWSTLTQSSWNDALSKLLYSVMVSLKPDYTLMQFTGLKDKNGVQYCQDDIVNFKGVNYRLIKGSYMFELLGFNRATQDTPSDFFSETAYLEAEIIGNIYENPELLNQ